MATLLYRLGRFSYRHGWQVIVAWVLLLAALLGGGLALGGKFQESFSIPGTESQQALDTLDALFPSAAGAAGQVVYVMPAGTTADDPANKAAIEAELGSIEKIPQVASVLSPYSEYATNAISSDKTAAYASVQFAGASADLAQANLDAVAATGDPLRDSGFTVEFGGEAFQKNTVGFSPTEALGVLFAGVVLFITFGSLLAAGMPLLTALLGVGVSMGGVLIASALTTMGSTAPMLAVMIGLAVGIDYALFILSRHRTRLAQGDTPEESAAQSVATAGSAVVFAGVTVIIALLGLLVVGIPFLSVMGVIAAIAVAVAVFVALTLLPAIMGLAKSRLVPKPGSRAERRAIAQAGADSARPSLGARWVSLVMKAPVVFIVGVIGLLGVASIPAFSMDLNLPNAGQESPDTSPRRAYDLMAEHFGPGYNGTLVVTADITQTTDVKGVLTGIADQLRTVPGVASVSQGIPDATLDTAIFRVIPTTAPDDPATKTVVNDVRGLEGTITDTFHTPIAVTGYTAITIDISTLLTQALVPFGILVVGLSVILLAMVFRSVAVPLKAALGFVLSVGASFGVSVAVFQWGWAADLLHVDKTGPLISFLPILLMAILFGLAMDYEVFLVSGMREEFVKTRDAKRAVRVGFVHGARVVTAAALIMFFVFFAFVPEGTGAIKMIALALAVGVFADAFLVRMTLVPAVMALLGRGAWWLPRWLDRVLPNVDVEGERLREHLDQSEWALAHSGPAIAAEGLLVPGRDQPVTFSMERGTLTVISGEEFERRTFGAVVTGRIAATSGELQVLGHALPSEARAVARRSVLVDLGAPVPGLDSTVGRALRERISLSRPWYRPFVAADDVLDAIERINAALAVSDPTAPPVREASHFSELSAPATTLVLVALGLAEHPDLVVVDCGDGATAPGGYRLLDAIGRLLPEGTTAIVAIADAGAFDLDTHPAGAHVATGRVAQLALSHPRTASTRTGNR